MSNAHQFEIDARSTEGRHAKLRVRIANLVNDWGRGTFVTLPNGQNVRVLAKGIYQAIDSAAYCRSDDPHAS
jgi:hypothetical protein